MRQHTELVVHLGQLSENYNLVKEIAPNNETIFMVKANAYGHGILEIVHHSFYELGITRFGCASLGEALEVRKNFPTMECELWVFSDSNLNDENSKEAYLDFRINPVIHNQEDLVRIITDKEFNHLPLVIMLDTGMHRLGLDPDNLEEVIKLLKINGRKNIFHLMTHFANSFLPLKEKDKNHRQYNLFKECLKKFRESGITVEETSCSNSGAIEQSFALEESHIRPGLMMYGPSSMMKSQNWEGCCAFCSLSAF